MVCGFVTKESRKLNRWVRKEQTANDNNFIK